MKTLIIPEQKIELFMLSELGDDSKQDAIQWYRELKQDDMVFEMSFCTEDLQEQLETIFGFESKSIEWCLFVQGSGACFEPIINDFEKIVNNLILCGQLSIEHLKLIEYYNNDMVQLNQYRINHHYSHENSYCVEIFFNDASFHYSVQSENIVDEFNAAFADYYKSICNYFYSSIQSEYDYRLSDDCIQEDIEANYYYFDIDGKNINVDNGDIKE